MMKYGDVLKSTNDFFKKTFGSGHSVEVTSKTDAGVTIKSSAKVDGKASASLEASKFSYGKFSLDKAKASTSGEVEAELSFKGVTPGVDKVTVALKDGDAPDAERKADIKVASQQKKFSVDADLMLATGPNVRVAAVLGLVEGVMAGVETVVQTNLLDAMASGKDAAAGAGAAAPAAATSIGVKDLDVLVGYNRGNTTLGLQSGSWFDKATFGVQTQAAGVDTFVKLGMPLKKWVVPAAQAPASTAAPAPAPAAAAKKGPSITVDFGAKYQWAQGVKVAGAVNSAGLVKLAYGLDVAPNATLNVYGSVDASSIESSNHSFGTKLELRH